MLHTKSSSGVVMDGIMFFFETDVSDSNSNTVVIFVKIASIELNIILRVLIIIKGSLKA